LNGRPGNLRPLIGPGEIEEMVAELAGRIMADYRDRDPVLVCVLGGALVFFSDLIRAVEMPFEVDFLKASCYGKCGTPAAEVCITGEPEVELAGRDVIVVEDIVDRGVTARELVKHVERQGAASVVVCALLVREGRSAEGMDVRYAGRQIGPGFVVGYGMDLGGRYRGLRSIYVAD
jgi:hypoxanthine phosphoribosyltransferase